MVAGSVEIRFYSAFSRCRRCLSPFLGGDTGARAKGGQAPNWRRFSTGSTPIGARSQSPFCTHRLQFEATLNMHLDEKNMLQREIDAHEHENPTGGHPRPPFDL